MFDTFAVAVLFNVLPFAVLTFAVCRIAVGVKRTVSAR